MIKKDDLRIFLTIICFIFMGTAGCDTDLGPKETPRAEKGVLDLTSWNFETDGPAALNGQWEFYWRKQVTPDSLFSKEKNGFSGYITVPGVWNGFRAGDPKITGHGYATYRLVVRLGNTENKLALKLLDAATSFRVYVNGKMLTSVGNPGKTPAGMIPGFEPRVVDFDMDGNRLEILLHVANFHHWQGGLWELIKLGPVRDLWEERQKNLLFAFFLFGSLTIMGFYHIVLFLLRKDDHSPLYFGIFCLLIATRTLTTGERYVMDFFPGLQWEILNKSIYICLYSAIPFFCMYMRSIFPQEFSNKMLNLIKLIGFTLTALVLVTSARLYTYTMPWFQLFIVFLIIYNLFVLFKALLNKRKGSLIFLIGFTILLITSLNDILYSRQLIQSSYLVPFGLFIFIFSQAFLLAMRFSIAFSTVERQKHQLDRAILAYRNEIKERRKTEAALRDSEEKYRLLFTHAPAGISELDLIKGRFTSVNDVFCKHTGYTEEELLSMGPQDVLTEEGRQIFHRQLKSLQDVETIPTDPELRILDKNGRERWIHLNIRFHSHNVETQGATVVVHDITERRQAEEALKEWEKKYRTLIENANEGILVILDGQVAFANPQVLENSGYTLEELSGRNFTEFIHENDREAVIDRYLRVFKGEALSNLMEYRIVDQAGRILWVTSHSVLIKWEGQNAVLTFMSEITTQKHAEEERARLREQLQQSQKMEAVGTLASGIAHDFNNFLQALSGYLELMARDCRGNAAVQPYLAEMDQSVGRAAELVNQLLTFSRKVESNLKPISVNQNLGHAINILERTIPKMIEIESDLADELYPINGDPRQLEQILLNLGTNAKDAMPDGGRLTITTRNVFLDEAFCRSFPRLTPGGYVQLTVADTGIGMDEDTLSHIFEPFFTTKGLGKGTGLGMATVYGIVQRHGGTITCKSRPGEGAAFRLLFPALPVDTWVGREFDPDRGDVAGGQETILVVDDERAIRETARDILEGYGYTIITEPNGESALHRYRHEAGMIDLVILDLGMPGMGGGACLKELLRMDPNAKIIIASGYLTEGQTQVNIADGAKGFIRKPYRLTDLLQIIREVLGEN